MTPPRTVSIDVERTFNKVPVLIDGTQIVYCKVTAEGLN